MMSKSKLELVNVCLGRLIETIYITLDINNDKEIEFTRHTVEEYGSVVEHEITIENDKDRKFFESLDDDTQEEITELIQSINSQDY